MKIKVFEREVGQTTNDFINQVNDWLKKHLVVNADINYGYSRFGHIQTVTVVRKDFTINEYMV